MRLAVRVGEVMVANTETSADCQYNMRRILTAYGVTDCSVRVVLNAITLSWLPPEGEPVTLVRVVAADQAHLHRLSMVERLVGRIERGEITAQDPVDSLVVAVGHDEFRDMPLAALKSMCRSTEPVLADVKALYDRQAATAAGFSVFRL
jgi:uncharacterized membrane protein YjjP (DUF1212 family)